MKKKAIVLLAFAVALAAVSCQKEAMKEAETTPTGEGMTISAVSEGIGAKTKVEMAYKYDLLWQKDDEILVKKGTTEATFKLQSGEKTTKGTFTCQSSPFQAGDEVDAYYPKSIVSEGNPVWPATMTDNQTVPMYCKKTLSSTQNQTFNFASLGSVLQLTFSTTSSDIILKSIEVKADEAMSGAFTVENGQAKVSQPEGDKPGITLNLGDEGVKVGVTAKKFNIAVPAGEYNNLTITFIAKDGQKCPIHATKAQNLVFNTVNTLAVSGEFRPDLPAGVLPGVFTVSNDDGQTTKQICFSQGNLYYDGSKFNFEANQYGFNGSSQYQSTYVSHFFWSKDASVACANTYSESGTTGTDVFFTNVDGFKVNVGGKEQSGWRTLSTKEWQYLFNTRTMKNGDARSENLTSSGIKVEGVTFKGVVLFPDDFTEQTTWKETYTTWKALNDAGIVFLPAAGYRFGFNVFNVGVGGYYWSSTAHNENYAYYVYFDSFNVTPDGYDSRGLGYSVRLITEYQSEPSAE